MPDKEVFFIGEQPHDAKVSCGCLFAVLAKFRGKINLPDKIIVYVNLLDTMAVGFVWGVDNHLFHELTPHRSNNKKMLPLYRTPRPYARTGSLRLL